MKPVKKLLFFLCCFSAAITCEAQLAAAFTASATSGCSPIVINFTDLSTGNPAEWKWDLGNGTISTLKNPSATYLSPGFYTIRLRVKSANRIDSVTRVNYLHINNSPAVDFSAGNNTGCSPMAVSFVDHSRLDGGSIISRQWDFGDGNLSTGQNPQHTYSLPGNFNVTLKVIASDGCTGTLRKSSYIINGGAKAAFSNLAPGICHPNKITFQNQSSGDGALHYNWQFGDGTNSSETSPAHTYSAAGIYSVKLVVFSQLGCRDSVIKNFTVSMPLAASFTADNIINCTAPATVQFTSQATSDNTYYWSFGDTTYSAVSNPAHQYQDTGAYSVKLVVRNNSGCVDSLLINNYIHVQKPYVNFLGLPDSGCIPFNKYFAADIYSHDSIINYSWKMGSQILLPGQFPEYSFTTPGTYGLSLVTTSAHGCIDTTSLSNAISVGHKPIARFSADVRNTCARNTISFTDLSAGNITSWLWDFGDGVFSTQKNPTHSYLDTGWMTVNLIARDGGCAEMVTYSEYIYIKPSVAKYKVMMDCDSPYTRKFNNFSIGATRWQWDFGDGSFSTEFSPAHIFASQGNYSVVLNTWNDSTGCSFSSTKTVKVVDVTAAFSATNTFACKQGIVQFNAVPNPEIVMHYWYFGDGVYLNTIHPTATHKFNTPGTYLTRLIVKDSLGCTDLLMKNNYITVGGPVAKFSSSAYNTCVNMPVAFIDSSVVSNLNPVKKWEWNYGDGNTDTLFSPPFYHTYLNAGAYRPLVKLTDSMGCTDTFRIVRPIVAGKISPVMYVSDSVACPGYLLKFICPYNTPGTVYRWDFGDGQISSLSIVNHSYAAEGTYTVKIYISTLNGCTDSSILMNAVRIKKTRADFALSDSFSTCPPLLVMFSGNSVNAVGEYWDFGDSTYTDMVNPSHYYTYPGEYNAKLIAKGHGACADTMQRKIIIKGPRGAIANSQHFSCKPYSYNFIAHTQDAVSYVWDFDYGVTQNQNDSIVNHVYTDSGKFVPRIILEDIFGCRVPVVSKDTLVNIFVNTKLILSDSFICSGANVSFTHSTTSNDLTTGFAWDFGDSTFSVLPNTRHQYSLAGSFYPSLVVKTAGGCASSFRSAMPVKVSPSPSASIIATGSGCAPLYASLKAVSNNADSSGIKWKWDMGNGDTSVLQNPTVAAYNIAGNYTITLSATNREGCSKILQHTIAVYPSPATVIHGDSALCRGQSVSLYANGAESYLWAQGTGLSCDTCAIATVQPVVTTQYVVKGFSVKGCSSDDTLNLTVFQPFFLK